MPCEALYRTVPQESAWIPTGVTKSLLSDAANGSDILIHVQTAQGERANSRRLVRMRPQPTYIEDLAEGLSVQLVQVLEEARPHILDSMNEDRYTAFLESIEIRARDYLRRNL